MVLTFIAPAHRCNQRCPACYLTEVTGEPVTRFDLEPEDYAQYVRQFVDARVPILSMSFQGYEVTLPKSWPYLEAVLGVATRYDLRAGFVTNGMLLHKWTDRIASLEPARITVSLDGASEVVNDRLRGLPGALRTTLASVRSFLTAAPGMARRMAVATCLYDVQQADDLLTMPSLLRELGVERWALAVELTATPDGIRPRQDKQTLIHWVEPLLERARQVGIRCYVNDEFGFFGQDPGATVGPRRIFDPDFLFRLEPTGHVRLGRGALHQWDGASEVRWRPGIDNAVSSVGYQQRANAATRARAREASL